MIEKRGQIWIETVIYTLIALVLIGVVLSVIVPKIQEIQDGMIIEKLVEALEDINLKLIEMNEVPGNQRTIEIKVEKGLMKIDGINNKIFFEIETRKTYSQPGKDVEIIGGVMAHTEKSGKYNIVTLTSNYSGKYDIQYQGKDEIKSLTKASIPYKLKIINKEGTTTPIIDIETV